MFPSCDHIEPPIEKWWARLREGGGAAATRRRPTLMDGRGGGLFLVALVPLVAACAPTLLSEGGATRWTTVGSTGTLDTPHPATIVLEDFWVTVPTPGEAPGEASTTIRYNVADVGPPTGGGLTNRWDLTVHYIDVDPIGAETQRVFVELKELNRASGVVTTIATFDSDLHLFTDPPESITDWRERTVTGCRNVSAANSYYVEATLSRVTTPIAPLPRLGAIALEISEWSDVAPCP